MTVIGELEWRRRIPNLSIEIRNRNAYPGPQSELMIRIATTSRVPGRQGNSAIAWLGRHVHVVSGSWDNLTAGKIFRDFETRRAWFRAKHNHESPWSCGAGHGVDARLDGFTRRYHDFVCCNIRFRNKVFIEGILSITHLPAADCIFPWPPLLHREIPGVAVKESAIQHGRGPRSRSHLFLCAASRRGLEKLWKTWHRLFLPDHKYLKLWWKEFN